MDRSRPQKNLTALALLLALLVAGISVTANAGDSKSSDKERGFVSTGMGKSGGSKSGGGSGKMNTGPKAQPREKIQPVEPAKDRESIQPRT